MRRALAATGLLAALAAFAWAQGPSGSNGTMSEGLSGTGGLGGFARSAAPILAPGLSPPPALPATGEATEAPTKADTATEAAPPSSDDRNSGAATIAEGAAAAGDPIARLIDGQEDDERPPPQPTSSTSGPAYVPPLALPATPREAAAGSPVAGALASSPEIVPAKAGVVAAKTLFGATATPAPLAARAIGFYSRGCLSGAVSLPIDGETWQAMRLSRNRNWGHPNLVTLVERLARDAAAKDGWPGLLVGDLSQPRGGPMLTGHNSHQIGLDADIWLTPMPDRRLSEKERENLAATSMLAKDGIYADRAVLTARHKALIRRAASYSDVERVLVHPGIKKAMCEEAGADRRHFHKIRPYWGHHYHMHIRITCPKDSVGCRGQAPTSDDHGCGAEIDDWIKLLKKPPKPVRKDVPVVPPKPVTLADLPPECRTVLAVGAASEPVAGVPAGKAQRAAGSR